MGWCSHTVCSDNHLQQGSTTQTVARSGEHSNAALQTLSCRRRNMSRQGIGIHPGRGVPQGTELGLEEEMERGRVMELELTQGSLVVLGPVDWSVLGSGKARHLKRNKTSKQIECIFSITSCVKISSTILTCVL